jgi:hypothetical protein
VTGKIEGSVRRVTTGRQSVPFENVPVRLVYEDHNRDRGVRRTSASGWYVFDSLPLGKYTVRPEMKGYRVTGGKPEVQVTVSVDQTEVVIPPFYLVPL